MERSEDRETEAVKWRRMSLQKGSLQKGSLRRQYLEQDKQVVWYSLMSSEGRGFGTR